MKIKFERINSELRKQISLVIGSEMKDPRVSERIVGVTKVSVTPDLRFAKVYLSVFGEDREEIFSVIKSSAGFIRARLRERVDVRLVPELHFVLDNTEQRAAGIEKILAGLDIPKEDDGSDDGE